MKPLIYGGKLVLIFVAAGTLAAGPAFAKKPSWDENKKIEQEQPEENYQNPGRQGNKKGDRDKKGYDYQDRSRTEKGKKDLGKNDRPCKGNKGYGPSKKSGKSQKGYTQARKSDKSKGKHAHFKSSDRKVIKDYFDKEFRRGHCPPGLAKKGNGCMPPGQAKKWQIGKQLPREVVFYNLPSKVLNELPPPPAKHRYVRVAEDILLITSGVGMVVDAIEDLGATY